MPNDIFPNIDQYPMKGVGQSAQNAFQNIHQVYFHGSTGLVASSFGIPGITVTRTGTGAYSITYPKVGPDGACVIIPGIQAPTGHSYDATVVENFPNSGTARVNITRRSQFMGSGATQPAVSGTTQYQFNPVSGTVLNLLFFAKPVTRF